MGLSDRPPFRCQTCAVGDATPSPCPFVEHRYPAGTVLLHAGEIPAMVHYVRRGLVALTTEWGRRDVACAVRGQGTFVGLEVVDARAPEHRVITLTDVVVCRITGDRFAEWLGPSMCPLGVVARAAVREAAFRGAERRALEGTALQRVVRFLRSARDVERGARLNVANRVVAAVLQLRPERFSRIVTSLRRDGVLGAGPELCVVDEAALRALEA